VRRASRRQLCVNGIQEADGSIPFSSTKTKMKEATPESGVAFFVLGPLGTLYNGIAFRSWMWSDLRTPSMMAVTS
jgi:hypothetical protein